MVSLQQVFEAGGGGRHRPGPDGVDVIEPLRRRQRGDLRQAATDRGHPGIATQGDPPGDDFAHDTRHDR